MECYIRKKEKRVDDFLTSVEYHLFKRCQAIQSLSYIILLQWRHNGCDRVSNHQPHDCLLNRLFRRRSKKTPKLRVTGLCAGNSPGTGEFPAQMASNAENVSIWWRHHARDTKVTVEPAWLLLTTRCLLGTKTSVGTSRHSLYTG